jgi:60 kDa SS-A/Ro ribonucleoprotein
MKTNLAVKYSVNLTAQGAPAARITPEQELRRTVAACMLWEDGFYESGESVADRIKGLVPKCRPEFVAACAFEARTKMKLRHAPLLLVREMARCVPHAKLVGKLLPDVIQRADELAEFLAIYWKDGPQAAAVQAGQDRLGRAFGKFNEYALAKYNRDGAVKLRDVLFLCHAKPKDAEQDALWKRLVDGKLATPDTWEVALSAGADKKLTFERLMAEGNSARSRSCATCAT